MSSAAATAIIAAAPTREGANSELPASMAFFSAPGGGPIGDPADFESSLLSLVSINAIPEGRSDLEDLLRVMQRLSRDDMKMILVDDVRRRVRSSAFQDRAKAFFAKHPPFAALTEDEMCAIAAYTLERPDVSPYKILNAWLQSNRNQHVLDHVGPFYVLLYRALEKLPRLTVTANRGVQCREIQSLLDTYDNYEQRCKPGSDLAFWGIASFSTKSSVAGDPYFVGQPGEKGIVYSVGRLECVNISPLSLASAEEEVIPLPPLLLHVQSHFMTPQRKLVVACQQVVDPAAGYVVQRFKSQSLQLSEPGTPGRNPASSSASSPHSPLTPSPTSIRDIGTVTAAEVRPLDEDGFVELLRCCKIPRLVVDVMSKYTGSMFLKANFFERAFSQKVLEQHGIDDELHLEHLRALHARLALPPRDGELFDAVKRQDVAAVRSALERGASVNEKGRHVVKTDAEPEVDGVPVIYAAAFRGNVDIVQLLIAHSVDVNVVEPAGRRSPLLRAALAGNEAVVDALIRAGAEVDAARDNGSGPLMYACESGHLGVVTQLLQANANVNALTTDGSGSLYVAAQNGHVKCLEALVAAGAKLDPVSVPGRRGDGCSALMAAACNGRVECVRALLASGAAIDGEDNRGWTALTWAASRGQLECVRLLVAGGAALDASSSARMALSPLCCSALIAAAQTGHASIVAELLRAGASKAARCAAGRTALGHALARGHADVVRVLGGTASWKPVCATCSVEHDGPPPPAWECQTCKNGKCWEPDQHSVCCAFCAKQFGVFTRRHHCFSCGRLACAACSETRVMMRDRGYDSSVRVCPTCAEEFIQQ